MMIESIEEILSNYEERIVAKREIKAREASYVPIPENMNEELKSCIKGMGFDKLYSHQGEMFTRAIKGESLVITTGTASGKSLAFYLPVIQRILENPSRRAIFIYPTKALTKDQLRNIVSFVEYFGDQRIQAGIYDGDTPPIERTRIREQANIILTNPDMINASFLPNHNRYSFPHLFRNLDYIVIDELHAYRGAFGSHVSNVFRRLLRICSYHGNTPQFLCSSATIANPLELAENICHTKFSLIDNDGSPSPEKNIYFWQAEFMKKSQRKRSITEELKTILPVLVENHVRAITFCTSRRETEVVTKETRDILANDPLGLSAGYADKISAYRGGYTPLERQKIEKSLVDGSLYNVVSTSALELGIDIGALDMVIMGGFPLTKASFWQQLGRAGRKGNRAHAILMLKEKPLDQYVGMNPDWLMKSESENAVVDKNNLYIQLAHIRAASAELPLSIDDISSFPDLGEIIPILQDIKELSEHHSQYQWSGKISPAHEISLRNISSDIIKVVDKIEEQTITTVDLLQAKKEFYPGAIYLHDSVQYKCVDLDLERKTAWVKKVNSNYYTEAHCPGTIDILMEHDKMQKHRITSLFGDVRISMVVEGYKMVEFNSHQNLGYESLTTVLHSQMETEACWIKIPQDIVDVFVATGKAPSLDVAQQNNDENKIPRFDYSDGLVHCLKAASAMRVMATHADIGGNIFTYADQDTNRQVSGIVLHDEFPGGLGYSEKIFEHLIDIIKNAGMMLRNCTCKNGCPACVGDHRIDKSLILWALRSLFKQLEVPKNIDFNYKVNTVNTSFNKIKWRDINNSWDIIIKEFELRKLFGSKFLSSVKKKQIKDDNLFLYVDQSLIKMINSSDTLIALTKQFSEVLELPSDFELHIRVIEESMDIKKQLKLQRMMSTKMKNDKN